MANDVVLSNEDIIDAMRGRLFDADQIAMVELILDDMRIGIRRSGMAKKKETDSLKESKMSKYHVLVLAGTYKWYHVEADSKEDATRQAEELAKKDRLGGDRAFLNSNHVVSDDELNAEERARFAQKQEK